MSILKMPIASVIYHSVNCEKVASTYLDLIQIERCDTENIVSALRAFLAQ